MTIRRQYSLPNCTLVLEGLSDAPPTGGGQIDARPLMTMLVSAECHFSGIAQPLSGGRDFLESLVRAVSRYAQEFLSQVHHPKLHGDQPELVQLQKLSDKNLHRLTLLATPNAIPVNTGGGMTSAPYGIMPQGQPTQIDLTTVQLFDLVEAIDQFLADRRTLPDLAVSLEPVSRRYRNADEPFTKRAAPAAMGVAGLAVSAFVLLLLPTPKMRQPKPATPQPNASATASPTPVSSPSATATPTPSTTPPSAAELENLLTSHPEITDPTQLRFLQRRLYRKIDDQWKNRRQIGQTLEYRVSLAKDGSIIGYKPVDSTPVDGAERTPLPELRYNPATENLAANEPLAQFRVVFNKRGILQISPWRGFTGKPTLGPQITDSAVVSKLKDQLYNQIRENWKTAPSFPRELVYRVGVTEEGVVADYEEKNQPAADYLDQTPLNSLIKPDAAGIGSKDTGALPQKPLAQFRVVFKPSGVLEVSPY